MINPLSTVKSDTEKETKPSQEPSKKIQSPTRGEQNIFASLSSGLMMDDSKENKAQAAVNIEDETKNVSEDIVVEIEKTKSESVKPDKEISSDEKQTKESIDKMDKDKEEQIDVVNDESIVEDMKNKDEVHLENKENLKEKEISVEEKSEEQKAENDLKETGASIETESDNMKEEIKKSEPLKRHDSEDSRGSHHHHHHHHRKHSHDRKESVSDDKSDSGSHRHESQDRRDSSDRRHSSDRRDSHSQDRRSSKSHRDKDRHGRKGSESKDRNRKDSVKDRRDSSSGTKETAKRTDSVKDRRESVGSVSSDKNGKSVQPSQVLKKTGKLNKDGKGKGKKSKKTDDLPIDSSMADLFMPDNLPTPTKEELGNKQTTDKEKKSENVQVKERVSKVSFKDDSVKSSKKTKSEKEEVVGPEVVKVENEQDLDELPDIVEESKVVEKNKLLKAEKNKDEPAVFVIDVSKAKSDKIDKSDTKKSSIIVGDLEIDKSEKESVSVNTNEAESEDIIVDVETEENVNEKVSSVDAEIKKEEESEVKAKEVKDSDKMEEKMKDNTEEEEVSDKKETDQTTDLKKTKSETETAEKLPAADVKTSSEETKENLTSGKKDVVQETVVTPKKPKVKNPLKMSDFFSERRLKINDPKPRQKVVKEESTTAEEGGGVNESSGRKRRNKSKAFADILKKEKLGSDDEGETDSDFEDDENDEDFEDPDELYCICRQPHNQRFMICCDKCEEWFHGKCVGITRARGAEMEKNNEEYECPQCKKGEIQDKNVASTTQSLEQLAKKPKDAENEKAENVTSAEPGSSSTEVIKPDSTVDKDTTQPVKEKTEQQTPKSSAAKAPGEATPKAQKTVKKTAVSLKSKQTGEAAPKSGLSKEQDLTPKSKSLKGQTTPKSDGKSKDKQGVSAKKKTESELSEKRKRVIQMVKEENEAKDKPKQPYNKCFTCNLKSPRKDSLYCSDECRAKHSKHNVVPGILKVRDKKEKKKEKHIAVVEPTTGRTLTGEKAPTESELKSWLEENPTFEILKSHNKPAAKLPVSTSDKKREDKEESRSSKSDRSKKSEGPEPIRLNVRKGLRDALAARAEAADDVMLSSSEIKSVALSVEEELFKYFKDTDHKYKAKYRSLIFNIKDQKNKGLFRKILGGRVRASKLVRMTADELANRELAQWREHETKHTIEMIKQTEREHMKEPVHVMKKTHKGEEEVQDEEGEDLSTLATEPKKKEEPTKAEHKEDEETENLPDTTDTHGQHLFDANCKICTGKLVPATETTPTKASAVKTETTPKTKEEEKELTKKERDLQADEVVKEVLKAIQRAKADERKEELEAQQRSAVTVRSPDSALSSGLDKNVKFTPIGPVLWKGFIYMQDVSKFVTTAYRVTGPADHLSIPDTITLCGRISPEHVWDYLNKVKQSATRDICVVRFIPGVNEEKVAYINLYSYLNSRSRCGVVEHKAKNIKDFYIVPLASHSKIPSVLLPFDGPGLEENRCHMLLGVIIRNKVKRSSLSSLDLPKSSHTRHSHRPSKSQPLKSALKDPFDPESPDKSSSSSPKTSSSSSTPQAIISEKKKAISFDPIVKEYSHVSEQDDSYEPGSDYPLDLNAPYDPEKEALKEPAKPKPEKSAKTDPVTLMMEKIAQSKNPAEATTAMVAALATTSKLGNQRKLLLELTKKVDEQKRLLEQKRISTKLGQSPSGSSPGPSSTTVVTSTSSSSIGISSKDPRLRAQNAAAVAAAAASASDKTESSVEPMDIDLRVPTGVQAPSGVPPPTGVPTPVGIPAVLGVPPSSGLSAPTASFTFTPSKPSSVLPSSITTSALEKSVSILSSLTSEIASDAASPVKPSTEKTKNEPQAAVKPFSTTVKSQSHTLTSSLVLGENKAEDKTKLAKLSVVSDSVVKPKGFYVDHREKEEMAKTNKTGSGSVSKIDKEEAGEHLTAVKSSENKNETVKSKFDDSVGKSEDEKTKKGAQHEIISQLMAEVSGKSVTDSKPIKKETDSEIQDEIQEPKKEQTEQTSKQVPNVAALFKGLANTGAGNTDASKKSGIQLPSALMSLFSKLPGSAEEPKEAAPAKIPGFFTAESEEAAEDTDLRQSEPTAETSVSTSDNKEEKDSEEKLSKSFLGFDYDSDSSGGSFEGFDDDGTKKLSPRKRKFIQKSPRALSPNKNSPRTNLFGDVDERGTPPIEDVDFRQHANNDVDLRPDTETQPKDIDERISVHIAGASGQPLPPGEGPMHPFPPPGLRLPFIPSSQPLPPGTESSQPPPPGVEWDHPTPMPNMAPPTGEWGHPPLPETSQPPLPAEPPMPKPPEPPVKKKRDDEGNKKDDDYSDNEGETKYQSKNSKKKKKKKERKNKKGGQVMSDERLKQIVLEIAKNEPIDPPPIPPMVRPMHGMRYGPPQQMMPMPPMGVPMPHGPPVMTSVPVTTQLMPPNMASMEMPSIGNTSWMNAGAAGPGLNTQSQMVPPNVPPHMQPGVATNPQHLGPALDSSSRQFKDRPKGPGGQHKGPTSKEYAKKPPSLLDLPTLVPPPKLLGKAAEMSSSSGSGSPSMRDTRGPNEDMSFNEPEQTFMQADMDPKDHIIDSVNQGVAMERRRDQEERSRERDRDERRRDRHRSRSGDRSRRSRSGERRYRSRSHERESDRHHRERSHDRDRHHYRDSRDRNRSRDHSRSRDRDRRSGRSHRH
ncbi:death-inducer obliterator 1-like isoform X2 [Mercenaria mercenaria]|uniref:death-inducer obliterator 1-like isoform X2 n=1 Tax=Mercenaria mercenaria TaxID=6596 RepID=UPI00234EE5E7|nr:death-inducer obliterator 1-like isoform X2 [Mercenaria mercenaria]